MSGKTAAPVIHTAIEQCDEEVPVLQTTASQTRTETGSPSKLRAQRCSGGEGNRTETSKEERHAATAERTFHTESTEEWDAEGSVRHRLNHPSIFRSKTA